VIAQGLCRRLAVMRLDRGDDRVMFPERILVAAHGSERGGRQKRHGAMHEVKLLHQKAVMG
jgi:hypothetical protein